MDLSSVRIETDHLLLRELTALDFEGVHAYATDEEVVGMLRWGPNSEADTHAFIDTCIEDRKQVPRTRFTLAVVEKASDRVIGTVRLVVPIKSQRVGDLEYVLNREFWRRGYMGDAVQAALRFGFDELKLQRITGTCPAESWGSAAVMEKAGMTKEGRFDDHLQVNDGRWVAANVFSARRSVWPPPR